MSVLRCVGQALQSRQVEVLELTSDSDEFHLQCGDPSPPYLGLVELRLLIDNSCPPTSEGPAIQIEYENGAGEIRSEKLSMSIVRDTCVRMFKR